MTRGRTFLSLWLPVAAYVAFIFWLSSAPRPIPGIRFFPWIDKLYHLAEYTPLGSLLTRALRRTLAGLRWPVTGAVVLAVAAAVAGSDEYYQSFIDARISNVWDAVWDGVGAGLGFVLYRRRVARTP